MCEYIAYKEVKKYLAKKKPSKKYLVEWVNGLDDIMDSIHDNEEKYYMQGRSESDESDSDSDDECIKPSDMTYYVKDLIKTINLFKKNKVKVLTDEDLRSKLSEIIARYLFRENIKLDEVDVVSLLDFIDWNCLEVMEQGNDFASDESDAGYNIRTIMELAKKYDREITEFNNDDIIYCLLVAAQHCSYEDAMDFIIDNKIKLSKKMAKSNDGVVSDMIYYFKKDRNYDLLI